MRVVLKCKGRTEISGKLRQLAMEKFLKFAPRVKEPAVVELVFSEHAPPKHGEDKTISLIAELPGHKQPIHIEQYGHDFQDMLDELQERFEKVVRRWRIFEKIKLRFPLKYSIEKLASGLRRRP